MNNKIIFLIFIILYLLISLTCSPEQTPLPPPDGIRDPLINQPIIKGENWQQIVQDRSIFSLGECTLLDISEMKTRTVYHYNRDYGTFPAMVLQC